MQKIKKTDKDVIISISSGSIYQKLLEMAFTISISEALDEDISICYQVLCRVNFLVSGYYMTTIPKGSISAELSVPIINNDKVKDYENINMNYIGFGYNGNDTSNIYGI